MNGLLWNMTAYMNNLTGTCYFDNFKLSKVIFPPMDTVLMTPNYKGIIKGDIVEDVYLDNLVEVIDNRVEKVDNYAERVSSTYKIA